MDYDYYFFPGVGVVCLDRNGNRATEIIYIKINR